MTHHDDQFHDAELGPVIDRLEAERPMATSLELDLIKQRVRGRVGRSRRTESMRSRIAILATLALGMVLSTGGAGLAVSGFASQSDNAAQSQYGNSTPTPESTTQGGGGDVLGEEESGGPAGGGGGGGNESTPAGEETQSQPARQVEAGAQSSGGGEEQLPFTGFAAIPVLLGGVALLTTGLVLRRRTSDEK
jgi:hypothetical protein